LLNDIAFRAHRFKGTRYDCGSKLGHLQANLAYAFKDETLAVALKSWLKDNIQ
jgi:UTP--glucose-1-phosphate uridylyltransferase